MMKSKDTNHVQLKSPYRNTKTNLNKKVPVLKEIEDEVCEAINCKEKRQLECLQVKNHTEREREFEKKI